jgi:phage tail protein X
VAHSWDRGPGHLRVLVAAAFVLAALDARALELGDAQVRSTLGENLDLRIPVTIAKGESIQPSCFTLSGEPAASVPRISGARVSLERSAVATYLRVRTDSVVSDPAFVLGIVAACPGLSAEVRRDYSLLVDPRNSDQAQAAANAPPRDAGIPAEPAAAPAPFPSIATLIARIGDTLESIAKAIFPGNAPAKQSYIQALRDANPPLATLDERDPIPLDTAIALPDLRAFARARPHGKTRIVAAPSAPAGEVRTPPQARTPVREGRSAPPPRKRSPPPAIEPPPPATEPPPRTRGEAVATTRGTPAASKRRESVRNQTISPGFVLKLSSGEMDLSPSKSVNDRMRAQLRDRQLVLDADDQVAAVLALRDSVRQLESRVAELQLKLAGMPSSFPAPRAVEAVAPAPVKTPPQAPATPSKPPASSPPVVAAPPAPVERAPTPTAPVPAPTPPAPLAIAPAPVTTPPAPVATPPVPVAIAPAPAATPPAEKVEASPPPIAAPAPTLTPNKSTQPAPEFDWLYYGLWVLAFLLAAAAVLLAMRLVRRRRDEAEYDDAGEETQEPEGAHPEEAPPDEEIVVALEPFADEAAFENEPAPARPQRALDADVDIVTRFPDNNADDLRRRYIEERFPEIGKGAILLDDPDSVVKGARLFYEDRAVARAVELLTFAIERHPGEVKSWLALFEIFRLEALTGEFAELARRFREQHGKSDYWRKVQYFGREIDPGNELYAEKAVNTFETIGPAQARRLAAESSFDPIAENWLGAPMDFQNEVLANELRMALMATAGISESDLVPNPMPALRNVEMFSVA